MFLGPIMIGGLVEHASADAIPFTAQTVDLFQDKATIGSGQYGWASENWAEPINPVNGLYVVEESFQSSSEFQTHAGHTTYMQVGAQGPQGWRGNNYYGYYHTGHGGSDPSTPTNAQVSIVMKGT